MTDGRGLLKRNTNNNFFERISAPETYLQTEVIFNTATITMFMRKNFNRRSIYIKEVLILQEACVHCHCAHSQFNRPNKPGVSPFQKFNGKNLIIQMLEQHCGLKHGENRGDWMDSQAVMQQLCISKRKLQTLRDNEILPFAKLQNKTYYKKSDVEALLEKSYATPKSKTYGTK